MNKTKTILVTILIVAIAVLASYHNNTKKRILIVHSSYTDFPWAPQINGGIQQYVKECAANDTCPDAVIRYHYMDLRRHPTCEFYRSAANDARLVIQNWKPDVVIVVDDIGQSLVGVNYLQFKDGVDTEALYKQFANQAAQGGKCDKDPEKNDPSYFGLGQTSMANPPAVVFAGVNGDVDKYGYYQATNVTGIFEHKNPEAILQTIADLYRASSENNKPTSIQVLSDNSAVAASEKDFFENKLPAGIMSVPLEWKPVAYADTLDEWKQNIETANQNGSMLLIANYGQIKESTDANAAVVKTSVLISSTEKEARYPVLGAATNFIVDGGMLTLAVPGYEQGQVAIQMALRHINGEPIADIPRQEAKQFIVGMKKSLVTLRGLDLPLIYESFSRESGNFQE